jgi:hypothetical protein
MTTLEERLPLAVLSPLASLLPGRRTVVGSLRGRHHECRSSMRQIANERTGVITRIRCDGHP